MKEDRKAPAKIKEPENLVVFDPDNPSYEKQHLCIYLRQLLDEAEKGGIEDGRRGMGEAEKGGIGNGRGEMEAEKP